jgi:hypothetical protein
VAPLSRRPIGGGVREELHHRYRIHLRDGPTPAEVLDQVETAKQAAQGAVTSQQQHAGRPATQPWEQEILDAAGPELARKVIISEGWPQLQNRLSHLQASGVDVHERLRHAVTERELDTAVDKAITLVWRLKPGPHTPAQTKPAKSPTNGSPPSAKRTKSESDPERFAKKKWRPNIIETTAQSQRPVGSPWHTLCRCSDLEYRSSGQRDLSPRTGFPLITTVGPSAGRCRCSIGSSRSNPCARRAGKGGATPSNLALA